MIRFAITPEELRRRVDRIAPATNRRPSWLERAKAETRALRKLGEFKPLAWRSSSWSEAACEGSASASARRG